MLSLQSVLGTPWGLFPVGCAWNASKGRRSRGVLTSWLTSTEVLSVWRSSGSIMRSSRIAETAARCFRTSFQLLVSASLRQSVSCCLDLLQPLPPTPGLLLLQKQKQPVGTCLLSHPCSPAENHHCPPLVWWAIIMTSTDYLLATGPCCHYTFGVTGVCPGLCATFWSSWLNPLWSPISVQNIALTLSFLLVGEHDDYFKQTMVNTELH